jgi:tRNA dimethylallyltransferase
MQLPAIPDEKPVLIAGPTASGKSELALRIAETHGGVVVNADASQVYDCWQIITARPPAHDLARARHLLYGHIAYDQPYSTGHWLREIQTVLEGPDRPIIVGGSGLNFAALTEGLADIPQTPDTVRDAANLLPMDDLLEALDPTTRSRIDLQNRARVQRAYEVQVATGRSLAHWQDETPAPTLPLDQTTPLIICPDASVLTPKINRRFDTMIAQGALDEVAAMQDKYDPALPAFKAIGVPELMGHLAGDLTLEQAVERATIATRRYAKRQRTWLRARMQSWIDVTQVDLT